MDEELEELKRRKLQELQQQYREQQQQEVEAQKEQEQIDSQVKNILRQVMSPEARDRLARLKLGRPDLATAVERQIAMMAQAGHLNEKINDKTLVMILEKMSPQKREIKISRK